MAREAAGLALTQEAFAGLAEAMDRTPDVRTLGLVAVDIVEFAEAHAQRAAELAAQVAEACGGGR